MGYRTCCHTAANKFAGRNSDLSDHFLSFADLESFELYGTYDDEINPDRLRFSYNERQYHEGFANGFDLVNTDTPLPLFVSLQELFSKHLVKHDNFNPIVQSARLTSRDLFDNPTSATAQSAFAALSIAEQYGDLAEPQLPDPAPVLPVFEDVPSNLPKGAPSDEAHSASSNSPHARVDFTCSKCNRTWATASALK
jgi:hypothetical protein